MPAKELAALAATLALLTLVGCAHSDMQQYGEFDASQKTMTVPPGGLLAADLKNVLKQNGWKTVVDRGPRVVEGKLGEETRLEQFDTFKTRYRMALVFNRFDTCISFTSLPDAMYNYGLSVINNDTGEEVVVMGGSDCQHNIVNRFDAFLKGGTGTP